MRNSKVVSITLPPNMAAEAEDMAKREKRTMSELMREAFRRYQRQREWDEANAYGRAKAKEKGISEADVVRLIKEFRAEDQPAGRKKIAHGASRGKMIRATQPREGRKKSSGCNTP
jgi:Arc/MetJ-type ribon-helix-helix transcriptional regulator